MGRIISDNWQDQLCGHLHHAPVETLDPFLSFPGAQVFPPLSIAPEAGWRALPSPSKLSPQLA